MLNTKRRPFWISTANYYILAVAISLVAFFIIWQVLLKEDESPWITAGIIASLFLVFAVILRELILHKIYNRTISAQRQLDYNFHKGLKQKSNSSNTSKFSLEKNLALIKNIAIKSKDARALGNSPDSHLEVFELCNQYLQLNEKELETVGIGATRIAAFRRGREKVHSFHKFHLLSWASIESNLLIQTSKNLSAISDKLDNAQRALGVLDSAIEFYPNEKLLIDSILVVKDFIVSTRVSHWIEQAERAAFKENYKRAINHYRDALFFLARENERSPERDFIAQKINFEIDKLRGLLKNNNEEILPPPNK